MPSIPTVHVNGSSKTRLMAEHLAAQQAITSAIAALVAAMPRTEDFYPQGRPAFAAALAERRQQLDRLKAIEADLALVIEGISGQQGGRHVA